MRRYMITYLLVAVSLIAVAGGIGAVILPLHLQQIEFARFFTGAMAQVNLQELMALKAQVAAGTAKATLEQLKLLEALAAYESAKASSLSLAASLAVAATMIMQPIIGVTSDRTRSRWGRRAPWMVFGAILALAGVALMYYATSAGQLMAGYALASVACTVVGGPLSATVVDRIPAKKRGAMSAVAGVGLLVGYILGMAAAGVVYAKVGTASYLAFGVVILLLTLVFITLARDSSSQSLQVEKVSIAGHLNSFTFALRDPDFRWVFVARVIMLFGYSVSGTFGIYMLQSYIEPAMTAEQAAKTMPLLHLVGMPVTLLAMVISGRWSDRVGRRKPFVIGASLLLAASMAIPFIWPALWALYAQHFLAGIAVGTFLVVDQALLIDVLPDKKAAGRDLGIGTLASNLGQAIGPMVAGLVLAVTGGYRMIWLTALVLTALAALAVVPVKKVK